MGEAGLLGQLGLDPTRRAAILHADDVGMCHGANTAFVTLFRQGRLTSGSVMVPCPWFPEIAGIAAGETGETTLDLGVHLTLTSEWPQYRWGPLTRPNPAAGLTDADGYFPRNVAALAATAHPDAAEAEMRAQIDRALAAGIDATHIDTHMGAALAPSLIGAYARVGRDYRLPVLLPREGANYRRVLKLDLLAGPSRWAESIAELEAAGVPLVDDFRMTPGVPSDASDAAYRALIETLPPGLTFVAVHPNDSGDIETIVPPKAHFRTDEARLFGEGDISRWLEANGIQPVGMRPMRDLMRAGSLAKDP